MTDFNQFGSAKHGAPGDPQHCAKCEAMLTDALDGTLTAAEQATFDLHMLGCVNCSTMLADAQRGAAWLELLKSPRPEPSATLLDRILAQTTGQTGNLAGQSIQDKFASSEAAVAAERNPQLPTLLGRADATPLPVSGLTLPENPSNVLPFKRRIAAGFNLRSISHTLLQPRLAMTAAMAFFSVALTMNLTGVSLRDLHPSDLKPSSLKRSFYSANAHVVRYYDNLRVVYELESRVHDLQRSSDEDASSSSSTAPSKTTTAKPSPSSGSPSQQPGSKPDGKTSRPKPGPGTSRRESPGLGNMHYVVADTRNSSLVPSSPFAPLQSSNKLPSVKKYYITNVIQEGRLV